VQWNGYQKGGIVHDPDCKCGRIVEQKKGKNNE